MLEARRSAAVEDEGSEGRTGPGWTWASTGGAGWRRRAAAVEALVRGPMLEKSLGAGSSTTHNLYFPVSQCSQLILRSQYFKMP